MNYTRTTFLKARTAFLVLISIFSLNLVFSQYVVDFEGQGETKTGWALGTVSLSGLDWSLENVLIGTSDADFRNGERSARLRGYNDSQMTMTQDKIGGAGTISFLYSEYGTDNQVNWKVEISSDGGETWIQVGNDFMASGGNESPDLFEETVNIPGGVRIRIIQLGDAGTANRRLNIDDITITDFVADEPVISASPTLLTGFTQFLGQVSQTQTTTVLGTNLDGDVSVNVIEGDYQIALDEAGPYLESLTLTAGVDGNLPATPVYVRLNGDSEAEASNGLIELTSPNADNVQIQLEGEIVPMPSSVIIDFEGDGETKGSYAAGTVNLSGFNWNLNEVLIGTGQNDFKNGDRSARLRGRDGSVMEMIEDKPFGLSQVTFLYRQYHNDGDQQPWNVDYSNDGGATWNTIGEIIATDEVQTFSETLEISGNVRIRVILTTEPGEEGDRRINIDDIELSNYIPEPLIELSTNELTGFEQILPDASPSQSFTVSAIDLNELISISVSGEYEISLNETNDYTNFLTLNETDGEVEETTLYVRLNSDESIEEALGQITFTSAGAQGQTVNLTGTSFTVPELNVNPSMLSGFIQELGTPSDAQSFELSGSFLEDDVEISVSGDYEISLQEFSSFSNTIVISDISEELDATTIYVRLNGESVSNPANGLVTITSGNADVATVSLTGQIQNPQGIPTITSTTNDLADFLQIIGMPSEEQTFQVSGTSLEGDIAIVATGDYEISLIPGADFSQNLTLVPTDEEVELTTIYVRLNGDNLDEEALGEITVSTTGASDIVINLSGEIVEEPMLAASPTELTSFSQVVGTPSDVQSFTTLGVELQGNLTLVASENYEISLDEQTGYTDELSIEPTEGIVSPTEVFVRLNGVEALNPANGVVTISSPFAEDFLVNLSGVINPLLPAITVTQVSLTNFQQILPEPSNVQSFGVSAEYLNSNVVLEVSNDYEISLLPDEDFATSIELVELNSEVNLTTIYVRLNGEEESSPATGEIVISTEDVNDVIISLSGEILPEPVPTVTASEEVVSGFEQLLGAPSDEQSITISGENLEGDVMLSVSGDYEISFTSGADFATELSLTELGEELEETEIFIRLNGTVENENAVGVLTISSSGAEDVEVELEGVITLDCDIDVTITAEFSVAEVVEQDGATYAWLDCDNNFEVIPGEESSTFDSGSAIMNVAAVITIGDCSDTTECVLVGTNSTVENDMLSKINLYPNPVATNFHIELPVEKANSITVYSVIGELVHEKVDYTSGASINTSDWNKGVYIVKVNLSGEYITIRFVKQ